MTDKGVYSPTRILQGALNSSFQWQANISKLFRDMIDANFLHIFIDDLLGHGTTEDNMLDNLERVLKRAVETNLKFNVNKIQLSMHETRWCGKIYSSTGVKHDPSRVEALTKMAEPTTADQLSTFIHAVGWMRSSIPDFPHLMRPLQHVMDAVNARLKGLPNKQRLLSSIHLHDEGLWTNESSAGLAAVKETLKNMVELAYPKSTHVTCLLPDASDYAWGSIVTQILKEDLDLPIAEQRHEPLAFFGRRFTGSERRWSTYH